MKAYLSFFSVILAAFLSFHISFAQRDQDPNNSSINIANTSDSHLLYSNNDISVSHIHPNPANDETFLDYEIHHLDTGAKIVLHNVLGGLVNEYKLDYHQNRLKIRTHNLKPGVYFYTLYVNNENLVTKKVIIKR